MIEFQPNRAESSSENAESGAERSTSTKKKKKLGGSIAREVVVPPPETAEPEKAQSLWQRMAAMAEKKEIDKQLLRPVEQADNDTKLAIRDEEKPVGSAEDEAAAPLETLSPEETHETVRQYVAARKEAVKHELRELPDAAAPPVESAADKAFLEDLEQQLKDDPDLEVEELLAAAEAATLERLNDEPETNEPEVVEAQPAGHPEGEIPLRGETANDDELPATIPLSSGGGGTTPPPPPPTGGMPAGGAAGGGGSGGDVPPPPYGGPMPAMGGNGPNVPMPQPGTNAALANMVPKEEAFAYERRAMGQGVLVGGIIGYLIGRRRGRIKTEKKLLPIQKKLEKQVVQLHGAILEKEERIRTLAAEKARALSTAEERTRLARRLLQAEAAPTLVAERRPNAPTVPKVERLGRVLVEAPAVSAAHVPGAGETPRVEAAVDMSRKVETYTTAELKEAAAKIRVEGVTLKELWDTDRLDEPALRRVMTEFIEGRSIHGALNKELLERELRVEKDPKLRDAIRRQMAGGSTSAVVAAVAGAALLRHEKQPQEASESRQAAPQPNYKKDTQKSAADKAKQQERIELAAGLAILGVIIILIVISL